MHWVNEVRHPPQLSGAAGMFDNLACCCSQRNRSALVFQTNSPSYLREALRDKYAYWPKHLASRASDSFVFVSTASKPVIAFVIPSEPCLSSFVSGTHILRIVCALLLCLLQDSSRCSTICFVAWQLEWIDGEIWGNIWQRECIARIDPATGKVWNVCPPDFATIFMQYHAFLQFALQSARCRHADAHHCYHHSLWLVQVKSWILMDGITAKTRVAIQSPRMDVLNGDFP